MAGLNLAKCRKIVRAAFAKSKEMDMKPLAVIVLDAGGNVLAFERQDGAPVGRFQIAQAKANGAVMMGIPSSKIEEMAADRAAFATALSATYDGKLLPAKGGVLVKDKKGTIMGAVGVSGDTSDNDALCGVAGIEAAGFVAEA